MHAAMRRLDRYIAREILSHALLGLAVFSFVFFVPQLVRLMELVVRHNTSLPDVLILFFSILPAILTFTLPIAVLIGVLIGLGRLSADSELIAMNAVGLSLRRLLLPVGVLALCAALLTLLFTVVLGPLSLRTFRSLENDLRASQATFQVQPRVFDERFPPLVLYVQDVAAAATQWRGVFLADSSAANGSRLTLAVDAIVMADRASGKLDFHLGRGTTHEFSRRDPNRYHVTTFGESDLSLSVADVATPRSSPPSDAELSLRQLASFTGPRARNARIEFHRRFAFPAACLVFALIAIPLGARPRRGGRAAGFLITLLLISGYYLVFLIGAALARQGALSPAFGIWAANVLTASLGLLLLPRIERTHGEGLLLRWTDALVLRFRAVTLRAPQPAALQNSPVERHRPAARPRAVRTGGIPQLLDLYLLRRFTYYFVFILAGFILLFEAFTLFELLSDIARNRSPFLLVLNYFRYLALYLAYQLAPLAALIAVLVTLGVMAKNNELVACKASGVSVYRLSVPLLLASVLLAVGLFLLDATVLPYANQRQDALRNQIKGRPAQTFYQPRRQWIFGENTRVYNYDFFDPDRSLFGGLQVFELDPATFQMRRRVFASRAVWEIPTQTWRLESGWVRDFNGSEIVGFTPFQTLRLSELNEPPGYFNREVRQSYQMDAAEFRNYIRELQQAGFDVARLSVQWHRKFAFPLIAPISVLLGIPFALLVGTRGRVSGIALGVGIAIVYWAISALLEAMGAVGQLPPLMAGWAPDAIFAFLGVHFFLKMPT